MILDIITTERGIFNGRKTSEYKIQTYKPGRACPRGCRKDDIIGRPAFLNAEGSGKSEESITRMRIWIPMSLRGREESPFFQSRQFFSMGDMEVTLLDTPGHVDFSAEMERTLQVLDYAILVINGADGVQGHTQTLWRLLTQYKIPTFLFVNKMDQEGTDRERLLEELKKKLSGCCVDFSGELECSGAEAAGKKENPVDNSGKSPSAEGMQLKDNASEAEKENISGTQGASDKIIII